MTDPGGRLLSLVEIVGADGALSFRELRKPRGGLLAYYYLDGGREAVLDFGETRVRGRLATRWTGGERRWWIATPAPGPRGRFDAPGSRGLNGR